MDNGTYAVYRRGFDRVATERLIELCLAADATMAEFCAQHFHDLEYGLKLIARNTGRTSFRITRRFVDDPTGELTRRIAASAKK